MRLRASTESIAPSRVGEAQPRDNLANHLYIDTSRQSLQPQPREVTFGPSPPGRAAVIGLEQAGDSAKAAAENDPAVLRTARQAVLEEPMATCIAKGKL